MFPKRSILLGIVITSILPAASTEALTDRLATGFIAQPAAGHYWAMSSSYRASFDPNGVHLVRHGRRAAIRFPGARLQWQGEGASPGQVHFLGTESRSFTGAAVLRARNAYPGVDIVIRLRDGHLKSEFQLAAGVSPSAAGYCLEGAAVRAGPDGQSLRMDAGDGWLWEEAGLESWQDALDGRTIPRRSRFRVSGRCVRFDIAGVDPSLPLTIDPELAFSSYLGGGMFDAVTAVATDALGNIYLGGWTESSDFPALSGYQPTTGGRIDGFVAKVNPAGQLVFSSYLGGAGEDRVQAIVVDAAGAITVAGVTGSTNFPTLLPARGALAGGRDAFIARLNPAGNQLIFSTYLGGTAHDAALAVALDFSGNIIAGGETASTNFPTLGAFSSASGGGVDGFLARFSPAGALLSSTYLGGGSDDRIRGIAVSANGALHVTGSTASSNFPVAGAPFPTLRGSMDAFYTRFNALASGTSLSTYLGGAGGSALSEEAGYGITIDAFGRAWIAGVTPSTDFPGVSSGNQSTYGGGIADAFVAVFTASGSLEWTTYIGGAGLDAATSISAGSGFVGLAGYTTSNNLPVAGALQTARAGEYDAFWAAYSTAATVPLYISYLGGAGSDSALSAAASGSALAIGGSTLSANFPLQTPIQSSNPGSYGGFVSRLRFGPGPLTLTPASGSGLTGTFTFNISHVNGNASILNAAFLFNTGYSFENACYVYYDRPSNLIYLYRDAGPSWLSLTPGATSTVDNGVCAINGTGLTVNSTDSALSITLPITFAASFAGNKIVFANAYDAAGLGAGWPPLGVWSVVAPAAPVVASIAPASGTGLSQTFTAVYSDSGGASSIAAAGVFFNSVFTTANGCFFEWRRDTNSIFLFRDSDSAYLPVAPGSAAIVENANCSITGAGAAITAAGSQLTLTVPVTFKAGFVGARSTYAYAADSGGLTSGWQSVGSWTPVPAYPPVAASIAPAAGSGPAQTFTAVVLDGNGYSDITSVEFLVNASLVTLGGCSVRYDRPSNTAFLFRDSDSTWLPLSPGSATSVSNTKCTLSGSGLTVTVSGNSLTLTFLLSFQPEFSGAKSTYLRVSDSANLSSGWVLAGTWSVIQPSAPTLTSLTPASSASASQTFSVVLSDANGNSDIASVLFLAGPTLNGSNGCYISYSRAANLFSLFRDSDSSWQSISPGSAGTVSNANCSISGAALAVSPAGDTLTLTLPLSASSTFAGLKNLYVNVTDAGGATSNWLTAGSWTPPGLTLAPTVVSLAPSSGSGAQQNFTFVLSDANGYANISSAVIIINSSLSGNNACYISLETTSRVFHLFRDSDLTWQAIAPGAASSVSNNNCALSGTGLSISGSGNTLTVVLPLSFQPVFSGIRNFYILAGDAGGLSSGWITAGTWSPSGAPSPPTVSSLNPNSGSGVAQTFTVVLSDLNGFTNIANTVFLINGGIDGNNACYISFSRTANSFSLFRDSDASWQPITPGASTSVTNNNCALAGLGLSVVGAGNSLTIQLPLSFKAEFSGARNFYILVADAGGLSSGWIVAGTWNPSGVAAPPAVSSLSPNAGGGAAQAFTAVLTDPNGFTNIANVTFLLNGGIDGNNACYISFNRIANLFYLFRDSDVSWQQIAPGANASVTNNNCTLAGSGLSVAGSGNTLAIVLPLSFKPAFSGVRNFYIFAADAGSLSSGWITAGSWNPSAAAYPPAVSSFSPGSGRGSVQTFTAVLSDPNGFADIANATFLINGGIDGNNACYISFNRAANTFYLFRDSDASWLPIVPAAASSVTNANCTLAGSGLAATGAGTTLTISLPLTFKPVFTGVRNFYILAADSGNLSSGWIIAGTWRGD